MPTVTVRRTIAAPIDDVFDWLSTATNYPQAPGVLRARLAEPGVDGAFGNGAVREVRTVAAWFREVISEHQPPTGYDYLIVESRPRLLHRRGQMRFREVTAGTEVTWTSEFEVPLPVGAGIVGRVLAAVARTGFTLVLKAAERDLADTP